MNTKPIPAIITLLAAGISCLASVIQGVEFSVFTVRLLVSVICFLVIGSVIRFIADKSLQTLEEESETEETPEEPAEDTEDIRTENDSEEES